MSETEAMEVERLLKLHQLGILDTPGDAYFRAIAEQAMILFPGTSIAALSLIDRDRQWFKTILGLDAKETPRSTSFCSHTIKTEGVMVVPDATCDARFANNPLVTSAPRIRFYAGAKLTNGVGALCVIGLQPRQTTEREIAKLVRLAQYADIQLLAHGALHNLISK